MTTMQDKRLADRRASRAIDVLLGATGGAALIVAATMVFLVLRPGHWTAVVLIVDGLVLFTAAIVLLFGWALRRSLSRAERVPWAEIVVWSLVGVVPIVGFALAHGLKMLGELG